MSDTQWPVYEVFQQERPGEPHRNVGSVHAPDPEIAMLNAKNVFVRRPECLSMWVAPASQIFAKTSQQLTNPAWTEEAVARSPEPETYYVFQKQTQKLSDTYVVHAGEVEAHSPVEALQIALKTFTGSNPWVWWVCPERSITRSSDEDIESMFEPARDKHYRHQSFYRTVAKMRNIRKKGETDEAGLKTSPGG